jgi:uncharacterized protein (DUF58 family)
MFTRKFLMLVGTLLGVFAIGTTLRSADILILCFPLLFYFFFSLQGETPHTTISRTPIPERSMAESILPVSFSVFIENPLPFVEVYDRLGGRDRKMHFFLSPGHSETHFSYETTLRRGTTHIGPTRVRHFNFLFTRYWEDQLEADTTVVIPRIIPLKPLTLNPRRTRIFYGTLPSRKTGMGEDFFSLRDYIPGDEYRKINWKAFGRYGTLITNEYEALKTTDVVCILDARKETALGNDKDLLDYALDAVASLSVAVLNGGNRLGFFAYGDQFHYLYPGTTRRHLFKILSLLTEIQPGGYITLGYVKNFISAFFSDRSQLILVSPLLDDSVLKAVQSLYVLGYDTFIVSPSPISLEWMHCDHDIYHRLARKMLQKNRTTLLSQLNEYAVVIDWHVQDHLGKALSEVKLFRRFR